MEIRGLVVGLGNIGLNYDLDLDHKKYILTHSSSLAEHKSYELVGGCDISDIQRRKFNEYYNKSSYAKLEDALRETCPDIVCVSVPTKNHSYIIKEIFKHSNPTVILCEKPISYSYEEGVELDQLCSDKGCKLFVNYMRRSESACIELKEKINKSLIEGPFKGVCWYSKGLFHNGSHFLNLLEFWLGEAVSHKILTKGKSTISSDFEPDFLVNFKNGEVIFVSAKEENFSFYNIDLIGLNGRIKYGHNGKISWQGVIRDKVYENYNVIDSKKNFLVSNSNFFQYNVLEEINKNINNISSNVCSSKDALSTIKFLNKIISKL